MGAANIIPLPVLKDLLQQTDDHALKNVEIRPRRGGPFGGSITVIDTRTGEQAPIILDANAVLATGRSKNHAESMVITPESVKKLKQVLSAIPPENAVVVLSSSGESCGACHSKEEILARTLLAEGLILPGNFIVTYGATYESTANVALFNDAAYHEDLQKEPGNGIVKFDRPAADTIPLSVMKIFNEATKPVAVVIVNGNILGVGYDERAENGDLMATAEVQAIAHANDAQKTAGVEKPYRLPDGVEIYTSTFARGPLAYTAYLWSSAQIVHEVSAPNAPEAASEAPGISNGDFYKLVGARPYNSPDAVARVIHIESFPNKAQRAWREQIDAENDQSAVYNGAKSPSPNA